MSESTAETAMTYYVTAAHEHPRAEFCGTTEWKTPAGAEAQRRFLETFGYTVTVVGVSR
jgi:phosphoglycerate dehydrogenase-like enzyme